MRLPVVGGNWKMNTDLAGAKALAGAVAAGCADLAGACEVVICPPFPYLEAVGRALAGTGLRLGAQDVFHESAGAFTGEVSPPMLLDLGVFYAIVGHSERRHVLGDGEDLVGRKARAALEAGLSVILCVGETIDQREAGRTEAVNVHQVTAGLRQVPPDAMSSVVIAYEPVWAIGTGRTASPADAQAVHGLIRATLAGLYDKHVAELTRIQYGGSVKANNARELFAQPDIDGGLIGGASLDPDQFTSIVRSAVETAGEAAARR